ncbi:MAG TPA: nitroreductase family deazaflavin-dependent oxidoreductase [Actinomycetota bacterium]|jgi:deazaflavin-dependent oxidoreductase (nitroreductase family)|nr:nitroreductase family deazaflavin-dependent oxidoreductase [Actinomycetota bacterium]
MSDWNTKIIDEFHENEGKVGGPFEGATLLLLHSKGRKSGKPRVNPLAYQRLDNGYAVFGSKGGAPTHPEWYRNVLAHPDVEVEVGTVTHKVKAREAVGEERERIWTKQKQLMPGFADYEKKTDRQIPVIVLERAD